MRPFRGGGDAMHDCKPARSRILISADFDVLSNRELQVAELLRMGLNNRNIAERLGVSPKTVGTYKVRLMEKLGSRTTPELLAHVHAALP